MSHTNATQEEHPTLSRSSSNSEDVGIEFDDQLLQEHQTFETNVSPLPSNNKNKNTWRFIVTGILFACCGLVAIFLFITYENNLAAERNEKLIEEEYAKGMCVLRDRHHKRLGLVELEDDLEFNPLRVHIEEIEDLPKSTDVELYISQFGDMTNEEEFKQIFSIENEKVGNLGTLKTTKEGKLKNIELKFDSISLKGKRSVLGRGLAIMHENEVKARCVIGIGHPREDETQTAFVETEVHKATAVFKSSESDLSGEFLFTEEQHQDKTLLRLVGHVQGLEDDDTHYGLFVSKYGDQRQGGSFIGDEFATIGRVSHITNGRGCINSTLVSLHELSLAGEFDSSIIGKSLVLSSPYTNYLASETIGIAHPDADVNSSPCSQ